MALLYAVKSGAAYTVKTHIPDRNRHESDRTLCGKPKSQSAMAPSDNVASCKTCRNLFYGDY